MTNKTRPAPVGSPFDFAAALELAEVTPIPREILQACYTMKRGAELMRLQAARASNATDVDFFGNEFDPAVMAKPATSEITRGKTSEPKRPTKADSRRAPKPAAPAGPFVNLEVN